MKFLYLDNWGRPQPENRLETILRQQGWDVHRIDATRFDMPADIRYEGIFVSPSDAAAYDDAEWIRQEQRYLAKAAEAGIPMLGLCFGCQTLAWALLGPGAVYHRAEKEAGLGTISLTADGKNDPLTGAMPDEFEVFHWHGDEVVPSHPDMTVLASGPNCGNQIWRWRRGAAWGVQPHPEYDGAGLRKWMACNAAQFESGGFSPDTIEEDSSLCMQAGILFDRFIEYVRVSRSP